MLRTIETIIIHKNEIDLMRYTITNCIERENDLIKTNITYNLLIKQITTHRNAYF